MELIDTHSHIYDDAFNDDRAQVIERAMTTGVCRIMMPAIDSESHEILFDIARQFPTVCLPMIGLHPTSVNDNLRWQEELELVEKYLKSPPQGIAGFYGIGEVGLDLYWSQNWEREQMEAFEKQIMLSIQYELPLAIHTRAAWPQMLDMLGKFRDKGLRGVMHAYSGEYEQYARIKDYGDFLFGIGGVVTYKNSDMVDVVRRMALDDIVLETDCPYLTPVPFRGKRNESSYIVYILHKIAEIYGMAIEEVARVTTNNARRLFKIK